MLISSGTQETEKSSDVIKQNGGNFDTNKNMGYIGQNTTPVFIMTFCSSRNRIFPPRNTVRPYRNEMILLRDLTTPIIL